MQIKCGGQLSVKLSDMSPLQGTLKHRTQDHINTLIISLNTDGLLQPFILWRTPDKQFILDGHARHAAISQMSAQDPTLVDLPLPAVLVEAKTLEEARENLLTMNLRVGKITPRGLEAYIKDSPTIKIPPSMQIIVPKKALPTLTQKAPDPTTTIRLRVQKDKVAEFTAILKELSYIQIL